MTIAIQGNLGTGKTSLIKLIEAKLQTSTESFEDEGSQEKEYHEDIIGVATVDVWQQLSANPNVNLFEVLLSEMISKLSGVSLEEMNGVAGFASAISQAVSSALATEATTKATGNEEGQDDSPLGFILSCLFGSDEEKPKQEEEKPATGDDIEAFRNTFINALQQRAEELGKSEKARFVVFVDGLDHISPNLTLDLMEQIKAYLECPRCVFVLSVDETTVFEGAKKKLGDKVEKSRKKLLFDRLVQVPFQIPSSAYNLDKYIKDLLEGKEELANDFAVVIDVLLKNPTLRGIKRCINTMYLYLSVFGGQESVQDSSLPMLLAAVLLQVESPQGFAALAECAEGDAEGFVESLSAALEAKEISDDINWDRLPVLWQEEDNEVNVAKRNDFLAWVRKLS